MHILAVRPAFARHASTALGALVLAHTVGASELGAQRPASARVEASAPTGPPRPAASRLPRLLDGGAGAAGIRREQPGHTGWEWPAADGWSVGRPFGGSGHAHARRPPRRVQPLIVFVSPYASVYATSSWAGCGWIGAVASCTPASAAADADSAARRAVRTKVIEVMPGATAGPAAAHEAAHAAVAVEWLRDDVLRLRWGGGDPTVREVELVIADAARRVLASQRVSAAPYTAVFARDARTAMVGVGVLRSDGTSTLTLAPLGTPPDRRH